MSPRPVDWRSMPKKDRKAYARELARIEREREARRRRRNRRLGWTAAGLGVVAVAVVAVLAVQASARAAQVGPANTRSDGIVLSGDGTAISAARTAALDADEQPTATVVDRTSGVLDLVLSVDYRSPDAAALWTANGSAIQEWVTAGYATLEVHPVALTSADETWTTPDAPPGPSAASPTPPPTPRSPCTPRCSPRSPTSTPTGSAPTTS